ncbi:MAG: hypothetical protein J6Y74_04890 [Clostridia bacterium]|nr:hypothetical protein [Clostridia bacterium]
MKKIILIALILILAALPLTIAACSRVSQSDMLTNPYVTEGSEVFTYKMFHNDDEVGTMKLTFRKVADAAITLPDPTAESKVKIFSSFSGTHLTMTYALNGVFNDDSGSSEVLYDNAYAPLYSYKKETTSGKVRELVVRYDAKYAYTYRYEDGIIADHAEIKVKNTTHFDNEMIYAVVRASGISQASYTLSFASPNALTSTLETISISKVGDAKATIDDLVSTGTPEDEKAIPCYTFRLSISNSYASPYAISVAKEPLTIENENIHVSNVKKAILRIDEGEYHYVLKKIEVTEAAE